MAVIQVDRKPLSLAERTYIPQIVHGLKTTLKHLMAPNVTSACFLTPRSGSIIDISGSAIECNLGAMAGFAAAH